MKMRETSGGKDKELCVNNKLFLNPDRISLPDVDSDLSEQKRQLVIDYVTEKYGEEHVAQIITFGSIAAKSSLRDTARVLGVPAKDMLKLGKLVPDRPGISLKAAVHESTELKNLIKGNPLYERIYNIAEKIEGLPRQTGIHACFDTNTLIKTDRGFKKISKIRIGDLVLTHKNRYKEVVSTIQTETDREFTIRTSAALPIKCTANHPFLVRNAIYSGNKKIGYTMPFWKSADSLDENDYVCTPISKNTCSDIPYIDGVNTDSSQFWHLIGMYIGDGWTEFPKRGLVVKKYANDKRVIICSDKTEKKLSKIIKDLEYLNMSYRVSKSKTVLKVYIKSIPLYEYLQNFGKGAANKKLGDSIFSIPQKYVDSFLGGYLDADGYIRKDGYSFSTVSKDLAVELSYIVNCRKTPISYSCRPATRSKIEGREVNQKDLYRIIVGEKRKYFSNSFIDGDFLWHKIISVSSVQTKKIMYNLTVNDDNSYTANSVAVHNCGIVIGQKPISAYCPTAMITDDDGTRVVTSQFDGPECEEVGLVKFDFLGLRTLDVVESSLKQINPELDNPMSSDDIPIDDPKVYKFLSKGNTEGVFQFESSGMTSLLKKMFKDVKDTDSKEKGKEYFERLIAAVSLYRPGPMDEIPNYLSAMDSGLIKYDHPLLENILNSTYGVLVYQEQIMFAVRTLAGFSAGQSDTVRKAMGKKKLEIMNEYGEYFIYGSEKYDKAHPGSEKNIKGCINNGISESVAKSIWEKMVKFASYAFNKSHATCYAALGAKTAWLACYYPVEFMTGILNSYINNNEKLANYVSSCRQKNIKLYYPDVNRSDIKFKTVYNEGNNEKYKKGIIFGLSGINGVGTVAAREIIHERNQNGEFKSVEDFLERMADSKFNKRALEALILSGAFDSFGKTRAAYMNAFEDMMKLIKQVKKDSKKQMTLFEELNVSRYELNIKDCPEMNRVKRSTEEEKLLGCFISHPLDSYSKKLRAWENKKLYFKLAPFLDELIKSNSKTPKESRFAGIVKDKELALTRTGKQMLKFVLDDGSATIKCVVFGDDALKISSQIQDNSVIYLLGKTKNDDYGASCIVNQVYVFTDDDMNK